VINKYGNIEMWIPEEDGVTHINIYSKGKTELGRWLTNFSYSPFNHPEYGKFLSMEGFWYWDSRPRNLEKQWK
jgi:hypothetical protein